VVIGAVIDRNIEIKSGLSGDELIVLAGQSKLRNGSVVTVTEQQSDMTSVEGARK
jgi:ribosomal protein L24